MLFKVSGFSIVGDLGFDVLFQFSPFRFLAEVQGHLAVKSGSSEILSISIDFTLAGPGPWIARGHASFKILFVKVKVDFEKRFGEDATDALPEVAVLPKLLEELGKDTAWRGELGAGASTLVRLIDRERKAGEIVVDAAGIVAATQGILPLASEFTLFANAPASDARQVRILGGPYRRRGHRQGRRVRLVRARRVPRDVRSRQAEGVGLRVDAERLHHPQRRCCADRAGGAAAGALRADRLGRGRARRRGRHAPDNHAASAGTRRQGRIRAARAGRCGPTFRAGGRQRARPSEGLGHRRHGDRRALRRAVHRRSPPRRRHRARRSTRFVRRAAVRCTRTASSSPVRPPRRVVPHCSARARIRPTSKLRPKRSWRPEGAIIVASAVAHYSFSPWLRRGVAADLAVADDLGEHPDAGPAARASLPVDLSIVYTPKAGGAEVAGGTVGKTVQIVGPGDVAGLKREAILRTEPVDGTLQFVASELVCVEFYEEDLPWRYTPAGVGGAGTAALQTATVDRLVGARRGGVRLVRSGKPTAARAADARRRRGGQGAAADHRNVGVGARAGRPRARAGRETCRARSPQRPTMRWRG